MRRFPSAQPQRTVSSREGWAEGHSCSDPPQLAHGTWGSGTGQKSTGVAPPPNIFEFLCVYILYMDIYINYLCIQVRSNPGFPFIIQYQRVQTSMTHRRTQYCPILSPSDLLISTLKPKHVQEPFPKGLYPSVVMVGIPCCHMDS